ncbi:MAG: alpha-mannosidase [Ignavibacteriales bacterium]|nr:alpha-mannosidase [Ignavibacteriales bacterium]
MKVLIPIFMILIFSNSLHAEDNVKLIKQYNYAMKSQNHLEGFSKSIGENDFSYHSLRIDVTDALLTRCTDGKLAIEWLTQNVDKETKNGVWFTWIAAVDMKGGGQKFDVYINDIKRFEFIAGSDEERIFDNEEGGILEFTTIEYDQHNDAHGYMSLFTPASWITKGKPVKIKIIGQAAESNTWIIVYKANDVITYLQNLVKNETWLNVNLKYDNNVSYFNFRAPSPYRNKTLNVNVGSQEYTVKLELQNEIAVGKLELNNIDARKYGLAVNDESSELISFSTLNKNSKTQKLLQKSLLKNEIKIEDGITKIFCERIYKPHTVKNLLKLSQSKLSKGQINLMNSSHQDIAWMDSPEKCVIERDTMLLMPLYEKAINADPTYRFDVEDALMIKEFVQRHPDKKDGIKKLLNEGKISCGATFIQPYEEMYSGEALVRQFYFGKKWLKDEFNYHANVYWNVDVPGRLLQMPQIIKKSGVDYLMISRFEKGIYDWYSPDGSFVTTFSPGHYGDAFMPLHKNVYDAANYLAESSLYWEKYFTSNSDENVIPVLSDWDMSPAVDYSHVINNWESIIEIEDENENKISIELPKFKIQTAEEFLDQFVKSASDIPKIKGERPPVWLYIHGPSHYQALKASREADILLTAAEKFSTIDALTENNFSKYPSKRLANAWESKIYPDHGWGGKEGQLTDDLFLSKYIFAKSEASQLNENALNSIASKIQTDDKKGLPIVIFNSLNWVRTDPIKFSVNFKKGEMRFLKIIDDENNNIEIQLSGVSRYEDESIKEATVNFVAESVPSIGYKTFYLSKSKSENDAKNSANYESDFYKIELTNGGIKSIYDKELQQELLDVSKFSGGEIFTMKSEGNGAGEFSDIQKPTMQGFDKTGNYNTEWKIIENGPVYCSFKFRQSIRNAVVEQKIILYKKIKRIDFDVSLLNWEGVLYREFRMALPLNMKNAQVAYETAFGVSEVGKDEIDGAAGERYTTICKEIHPRGIENWIGANDGNYGVTLSSCVAVADYIDPTDLESKNTILQPILLASRKSCHGEGNEYLQTGDHHYSFSLTSHKSDWINGNSFGKEANEKLFVVVNPKQFKDAFLPEVKSFFSINKKNVIISTIKKAEDDNSTIVRFYDIEGKDTNVELQSFINISEAFKTNLIEDDIEKASSGKNKISLKLGHHSIETLKLITFP